MKRRLTLFLLICSVHVFSQSTVTCDILIDPEYKGIIDIYDKPSGNKKTSVKQDLKHEDFLTFTVLKETSEYFFGTLQFAISERKLTGWVRKAKYIGTYARNYQPKVPLNLYVKPTSKSKVKSIIPDWTNQIYQVTSFNKNWVYVKLKYKGTLKQGWLSPDMQCSNPYTTCN